jgi:hypothetical protein
MQPDLMRRVLLALIVSCPAAGEYATLERGRALLQAAKLGETETALRLLREPTLVNVRDLRGLTALEWAASAGDPKLAEALAEEGARISSKAIDLAAANGHAKLAGWLENKLRPAPVALRRKEANSALFRAASGGKLKDIRKALKAGAEVDAANDAGMTAFMLAARGGHIEAALLLADRGADRRPLEGDAKPGAAQALAAALSQMEPSFEALPKASFFRIRSLAAQIASSAQDTRLRDAAARAEKAVTRLWDRWAFAPSGASGGSPEYTASIYETEALLSDLAKQSSRDEAESISLMDGIAVDLETKLAHCIATGEPLGGVVRVRVHTRRGGGEVSNWRVFFVPKIFESMPDKAADAFPRFSSPTEIEIVPGRYLLWAKNPESDAVSERTTVRIGGTKETMTIDLAVP